MEECAWAVEEEEEYVELKRWLGKKRSTSSWCSAGAEFFFCYDSEVLY